MASAQKVSTCLWFDTQAEEAANYYVSLIPGSRVTAVSRYGKNARMPEGLALTVTFDLAGTEYMALNGGPIFQHSEAASIIVQCDDQLEIDRIWDALFADGGKEQRCGWIKDRYGLSWQIVPAKLRQLMTDGDKDKTARVMGALMQMVKLDLPRLEAAYEGH